MIRNLKALGLALVAMFALSAVVASGASAQTNGVITVEGGGTVTLDGIENGENYFRDPFLGSKVECPGSTITGHKLAITPHERIPNKSSSATITPKFINCNSGGLLATVTMNGCDFAFTLGETTVSEPTEYAVTAHVVCPEGKKIEVHVYASASSEAVPTCTYTIGSQTLSGAFDVKNDPTKIDIIEGKEVHTPDALIATGTSTEVKAERHGLCGNKTELFNTEQRINYTIYGTDELGTKRIGITVTH